VKDRWYGDKRDLVKWGVLLRLAIRYGAGRIIQVAYYRPESTPPEPIEIEGRKFPMPKAVCKHFRNVMDITRLSSPKLRIDVVKSEWTAGGRASGAYMKEVAAALAQLPADSPCIVFLDPDTGLEPPTNKHKPPNSNPKLEYVLESELAQIWKALRPKDLLVFYQHKPLLAPAKGAWWELKQRQFERALGLSQKEAKMARGEAATDVVFFLAPKAPTTDQTKKVCPECDHTFKGNGWDGIDAHWKAKHEDIMPYDEAWPRIKSGDHRRETRS
jgi:hypothetical protein